MRENRYLALCTLQCLRKDSGEVLGTVESSILYCLMHTPLNGPKNSFDDHDDHRRHDNAPNRNPVLAGP